MLSACDYEQTAPPSVFEQAWVSTHELPPSLFMGDLHDENFTTLFPRAFHQEPQVRGQAAAGLHVGDVMALPAATSAIDQPAMMLLHDMNLFDIPTTTIMEEHQATLATAQPVITLSSQITGFLSLDHRSLSLGPTDITELHDFPNAVDPSHTHIKPEPYHNISFLKSPSEPWNTPSTLANSPHTAPELIEDTRNLSIPVAPSYLLSGNSSVVADNTRPSASAPVAVRRQSLESEAVRGHHFYKNAFPSVHDGLYHCPFEGSPGCNHKPEKLKCNYDKFIDSHLKPYRCKAEACEGARFSSTACLLRHEREAHAMHGHGNRPFSCTYTGCDRSLPGNGFPRLWNLKDHMRRVHHDPGPVTTPRVSTSSASASATAVASAPLKDSNVSGSHQHYQEQQHQQAVIVGDSGGPEAFSKLGRDIHRKRKLEPSVSDSGRCVAVKTTASAAPRARNTNEGAGGYEAAHKQQQWWTQHAALTKLIVNMNPVSTDTISTIQQAQEGLSQLLSLSQDLNRLQEQGNPSGR